MLIPTGLSKKEKEAYVKKYAPKARKFVNVGPRAKLRPVGGDKKVKENGTKTFGKK